MSWKHNQHLYLMFMLVLINQGTRPDHLMLGFMLPTAFLSMWISNTATTAMMVPILEAVIAELESAEEEPEPDTRSDTTEDMATATLDVKKTRAAQ